MGALFAGLIVLGLLLLFAGGYVRASPKDLAKGVRRSGGILLALVTVALLLRGQLGYALLSGGAAWVLLFGTVPPWHRPDYGLGGTQSNGKNRQRTSAPP